MPARTHLDPAVPNQMVVLGGALAHLSTYLQTGCPRARHLARLLLHRLDREPAFDRALQALCRTLEEAAATVPMARQAA